MSGIYGGNRKLQIKEGVFESDPKPFKKYQTKRLHIDLGLTERT
jgi:hypothetical protein